MTSGSTTPSSIVGDGATDGIVLGTAGTDRCGAMTTGTVQDGTADSVQAGMVQATTEDSILVADVN